MGRVPQVGDAVTIRNLRLRVEAMTGRVIEKVSVSLVARARAEEPAAAEGGGPMSTLYETALWLVAIGGVALAALCSGMEIACYSMNRVRLALRVGRNPPDRAARIIRSELDQADRLLSTLLVWLNIATYAGALATTTLLETKITSPALVALVNTCVLQHRSCFIFGEAASPW